MVEAQIICTCPFIGIPDLGLTMKRGQSALIPEDKARASKDLQLANTNGGVTITYIERFQELKPALPSVPRKILLPKKPDSPPVEVVPVVRMTLDEDALVEKLAAKMNSFRSSRTNDLIDSLIGEVRSMKEDIAKGQQNPQIVRGVVHIEGKVIKEDVPMFIPKTIMGKEAGDVKIEIEEITSKGTVDKASDILRALRKKKKEDKS